MTNPQELVDHDREFQTPRRNVIDDIDALVDEQMAGGEPRQGYDYGDPTYPKCPHCDRHWHGLPLTAQIVSMYSTGYYDEDYSAADDDSQVLCQGSEFIGPMPTESVAYVDYTASVRYDRSGLRDSPHWLDELIAFTMAYAADCFAAMGLSVTADLWLPGDPAPSDPQGDPFGPLIQDGQLVTFIDHHGNSYTDRARVLGGHGDSASAIIIGELTGQHYENRRLPMRLEDV